MKLPFNKLAKVRNIVKNLLDKTIILYRELEIIIKFLLFVAKIIISGRVFLRRFFNAIIKPVIIIRIITVIKKDLL